MDYKPLFEDKFKSFKLVKLSDKDNFINKRNLRINSYNDVIIFPVTDNIDDVFLSCKLLFGEMQYHTFIKQYYLPKRFNYKRTLIMGKPYKERIELEAVRDRIKEVLPRISKTLTNKIVNRKNTLVDYSTIFGFIKYNDPKLLINPKVLSKIELLIPEYLTYILMDNSNINVNSYIHTNGLYIYSNSETRHFNTLGFNRYLIPYRINLLDTNVLKKQYMDSTSALTRYIKTDVKSIYDISLIRFLMRCYGRDFYEKSYDIYNEWVEKFIQYNPIFFFYTNKLGFVFDMKELKINQKKDYNSVLRLLRERLILLIKSNNLELTNEEIDVFLEKENELEMKASGTKIITKIDSKSDNIITPASGEVSTVNEEKKIKQNFDDILLNVKNISNIKEMVKNNLDEKSDSITPEINDLKEKFERKIENVKDKTSHEIVDDDDETIFDDNDDTLESDTDISVDTEKEEDKNDEEDGIENDPEEFTESEMKDVLKAINLSTKPKRTPKQEKRIKLISQKYKSVKLDDNRTLEEIIEDTKATIIDPQIKKEVPIRNKSIFNSRSMDFEKSYVEKTFKKDIVSTILAFSKDKDVNFHVLDMKKDDTSDQFTYKDTYIVKFEDDNQRRHTLKVDIPKITEDGVIRINGNDKVLRKQLIFKPVVKIEPDTVWLTSYLNKVIIERNGLVTNKVSFLLKRLIMENLRTNPNVEIKYGNFTSNNRDYLTTIEFDELSEKYESITIKKRIEKVSFIFDINKLFSEYMKLEGKNLSMISEIKENPNLLPIGINYNEKKIIYLDITQPGSSVDQYILNTIRESGVVSNFEEIMSTTKVPSKKVFLRINIQSKQVPLIVFLSALFGFSNVVRKLGVKIEVTDKVVRSNSGIYENRIKFKDCYMYYSDYPSYQAFLLNGLYYLPTEEFEMVELESQMVYLEYLFNKFKSRNVIKGWFTFRELFLDPITVSILKDLNLPTDFLELFLYAASLLDDNHYLNEGDKDNYRLRGYEVIVECIYTALAAQYINIKHHKKGTFTIPQDIVMAKLHKSQILANKDTLNPMMEAKDKGTVTMKGPSGTNLKQAYSMNKRSYDKKSIQIFAMSSVDNANVGVIKQLSMDANILSTRGYLNTGDDKKKTTFSQLHSYEEGVIPYLECDDPSRQGFATIQTPHIEESKGSTPPIVRTGVESMIAYKIPQTFVRRAAKDGVITAINEEDKKIYITYKDGTKDVLRYGMEMCRNSNFFVENDLVCRVKVGQKVLKDDVVAYNKGWFADEGDKIVYKSGPLCVLAMLENESTEEDSSIISENLARKMETGIIKKKAITLTPNTLVHNYCKVGDHVLIGQPLMGFEETTTEETSKVMELLELEDDSFSADLLRKTPKANTSGTIIDMRIYWTIDPSELSPSLQKIVKDYIRKIRSDSADYEKFSGKTDILKYRAEITVPNKGRINGETVPEGGGVLIEYFISHDSGMSSGDKLSYNSSLKSVVSEVLPKELTPFTESGLQIDAMIGMLSAEARMINSLYKNGYLSSFLFRASKKYAKEFLSKVEKK